MFILCIYPSHICLRNTQIAYKAALFKLIGLSVCLARYCLHRLVVPFQGLKIFAMVLLPPAIHDFSSSNNRSSFDLCKAWIYSYLLLIPGSCTIRTKTSHCFSVLASCKYIRSDWGSILGGKRARPPPTNIYSHPPSTPNMRSCTNFFKEVFQKRETHTHTAAVSTPSQNEN